MKRFNDYEREAIIGAVSRRVDALKEEELRGKSLTTAYRMEKADLISALEKLKG